MNLSVNTCKIIYLSSSGWSACLIGALGVVQIEVSSGSAPRSSLCRSMVVVGSGKGTISSCSTILFSVVVDVRVGYREGDAI